MIMAVGACVTAPPIWGQDSSSSRVDRTAQSRPAASGQPNILPKMVGVWAAGAQNAGLRTRYGMKRERSLYISALRWTRTFAETSKGNWVYTTDVLPMVIATNTPFYRDTLVSRTVQTPTPDGGSSYITREFDSLILVNRTVYGAGWIPLGIGYESPQAGIAKLQLGLSAGAVYFDRRMPDPGETRMNFTLDGTVLIQLSVTKMHNLVVGYRFNHISNAHTGRVNPGMNTSMFQLGWNVRRQTRMVSGQPVANTESQGL